MIKKSLKTNFLRFALLLSLLLILSSNFVFSLSAEETYNVFEEVKNSQQSLYKDLEFGELFLLYPQEVYQNMPFQIKTVIIFNENNLNLDFKLLTQQEMEINSQFYSGDYTPTQPFLLSIWEINLDENQTYFLKLDDVELFNISIFPKENNVLEETLLFTQKFTSQDELTEDDTKYLVKLFEENNLFYSTVAINNMQELAKEINFEKNIELYQRKYTNGEIKNISKHTITLNNIINGSLNVIEIIPKELSPTLDGVTFSTTPVILEKDPIVMWTFNNNLKDNEEKLELSYELESDQEITGQTILLLESPQNNTSKSNIFYPLLIIPFIAIIVIYFSKFNTKNK